MRVFLSSLLFAALNVSATEGLPQAVSKALQAERIPASALAVYMVPVHGENTPLWHYRADVPMNPASTMKLVTSYAALVLLGPRYTWRTVLATSAKVRDGVLQGDLYIKGYGDPALSGEQIQRMLKALRDRGINEIDGDLLLDRSWFIHPPEPYPFDSTPERAYNVLPDALIFNANAFSVTASSDDQRVNLTIDPVLPVIQLNNTLTVARQVRCDDDQDLPRPVITEASAGKVNVEFAGTFPAYCSGTRWYQLLDTKRYVGSFFTMTWRRLGGQRWTGKVREAVMPANARVLYTHHSPPLAQVIQNINKFSNNTMARLVYLTLSGHTHPPTLQQSQYYLRRWLHSNQWATQSLRVENGSGLSRNERISARLLGQIIRHAMRSKVADAFESSLPIVGVDGTMQDRLTNDEIAGAAHIKTGSLRDVRAVAGTIDNINGKKAVIVAILNDENGVPSSKVLDEVLKYAWEIFNQ